MSFVWVACLHATWRQRATCIDGQPAGLMAPPPFCQTR